MSLGSCRGNHCRNHLLVRTRVRVNFTSALTRPKGGLRRNFCVVLLIQSLAR